MTAGSIAGSLFDLTGKVAVITGASRGIGRAVAERLAEHGANVVVSSRKVEACEEVIAAIRMRGGTAIAVQCHVGQRNDLRALIDAAVAHFGGIDILLGRQASTSMSGRPQQCRRNRSIRS